MPLVPSNRHLSVADSRIQKLCRRRKRHCVARDLIRLTAPRRERGTVTPLSTLDVSNCCYRVWWHGVCVGKLNQTHSETQFGVDLTNEISLHEVLVSWNWKAYRTSHETRHMEAMSHPDPFHEARYLFRTHLGCQLDYFSCALAVDPLTNFFNR